MEKQTDVSGLVMQVKAVSVRDARSFGIITTWVSYQGIIYARCSRYRNPADGRWFSVFMLYGWRGWRGTGFSFLVGPF